MTKLLIAMPVQCAVAVVAYFVIDTVWPHHPHINAGISVLVGVVGGRALLTQMARKEALMAGHEYVWVSELGSLYRIPQGIKKTVESIQEHGERIPRPAEIQPASVERCYELLGLFRQEVNRVFAVDAAGARQVMGEVSTFETDWWGSYG